MADFSRDVRRILREAGCYLVRQGKGDHEIWYSPITNTTFPVDGKIVASFSQRCSQGRWAPKDILNASNSRQIGPAPNESISDLP